MFNLFQQQNIPKPVKMVAAVYLLGAAVNIFYFVSYVMTAPIGPLALLKVLLGIAVAVGLLNLSTGWRTFALITSGLGVLVLPFYFLGMIFSSEFAEFLSKLSGINSWVVIELGVVVGFVMFLWIFRTLMRPDVSRAFQSGEQKSPAT